MFVAGAWVREIVVDPVGGRLYIANILGVEVINMDGSNKKKLLYHNVYGLAVDVKAR